MPRIPTARPLYEHHATVSRMIRQIHVAENLSMPRKKKILKLLTQLLEELQCEMPQGGE